MATKKENKLSQNKPVKKDDKINKKSYLFVWIKLIQ